MFRFWKRDVAPRHQGPWCVLVYVREGPGGDEPLCAVVATEDDARAFEERLARAHPRVELRWEDIPWHPSTGGDAELVTDDGPRTVVILSTGTIDNTLGHGVYADAHEARHVAEKLRHEAHVEMRTARVGEWFNDRYPLPEVN